MGGQQTDAPDIPAMLRDKVVDPRPGEIESDPGSVRPQWNRAEQFGRFPEAWRWLTDLQEAARRSYDPFPPPDPLHRWTTPRGLGFGGPHYLPPSFDAIPAMPDPQLPQPDFSPPGSARAVPVGMSEAPDPYTAMLADIKSKYRLLSDVPIDVTKGSGPYYSETYQPWQADNPTPGQLHIEMRHYEDQPRSRQDTENLITGETFHYLGNVKPDGQPVDPKWYAMKQQVWQTMPQHERQNAHDRWIDEQANPNADKRSFERFLQESYLDQYIGGVMNPLGFEQEWRDRARSLPKVAPQQAAVINQMRQYLTTGQ